ncbi:hypothetical protein PsYK624_089500 [Phanerochaete sordida]|uniref:Uncharacterized protein n=1 Tax=Phanerochaete sordida TaxID=48140 RepID=A0A9P3GB33_9APHY|nr:hypothetical protein PsYK624_089500 [Phanerochaete sordida]
MHSARRGTIATLVSPRVSPKDATSQPPTWVIEGASYGGVYISPTVGYLPSIPPRPKKRPGPWDALRRGWVTQQSFYHMFTPNINPFDDPLFYPLAPTLLSSAIVPLPVPGKPDNTAWQLQPAIAERWLLLEKFLLACEGSLAQWGLLLYPLDFRRPQPPSAFGFLGVFDTRASAHKAMGRSRAAFISLACLISLHIARLNVRIPPRRAHHWDRGMPLDGYMSPDVVDLLRRSWVGTPWVPRVGAFIDMPGSTSSRTCWERGTWSLLRG